MSEYNLSQLISDDTHFTEHSSSLLYFRNLLTHTVNNLLQMLNSIKSIQVFVVKQKFNIIYIMWENLKTIPWLLCKIQLI